MSVVSLPYDIVYCTSEMSDYPVSRIIPRTSVPETNSGGWQSAKMGKVPQTLVLRFPGNVWLQQIRILSHETKIASSVEVRVYSLTKELLKNPPSFRKARFTKLGSVDFNDNVQSGYRSKERKTVHLKTETYFLKLLFGKPYSNRHNEDQQIGIYMIECSGYMTAQIKKHVDVSIAGDITKVSVPVEGRGEERYDERPERQEEQRLSAVAMPNDNFSSFRSIRIMEFEDYFVRRAEELISLKEQASLVNDLALVELCKEKLMKLNTHSKELYELEQAKVQAIIEEDFDGAKASRDAMNTIMNRAYEEALLPEYQTEETNNAKSAEENIEKFRNGVAEGKLLFPEGSNSADDEEDGSEEEDNGDEGGDDDGEEEEDKKSGDDDSSNHSEGITAPDDEQEIDVAKLTAVQQKILKKILKEAGEDGPLYSVSVTYDTTLLNASIGSGATACLFSRKFKLRESCLSVLAAEIGNSYTGEEACNMEDCILRFLDLNYYGVQDSIANVFFASSKFVKTCLKDPCDCVSGVLTPLAALIQRFLTRASDTLPRVKEEAFSTLQCFVESSNIPSSALLSAVLAVPVDKERRSLPLTNARAQLTRLNFLQQLGDSGRLSLDSTSSAKLLNKVLIPGVNHANKEVRDLSTNIMVSLSTGSLVVKADQLAKINNNAIREQVQSMVRRK
ncbi:hypothetical protein AGDE_05992 [Angomonas deanei]|nr:hypothetical protein AGDE_05992 [Angomonas deanei]|eukprot:EPY37941.1 hypothetical protein AGDE_05992 [Angomonas deanei]